MESNRSSERTRPIRTIGEMERWASGITGGLLVVKGLARRSLTGVAMSFVGGLLLDRGLTGRSSAYTAMGTSTAESARADDYYERQPSGPMEGEPSVDRVDEASEESFPASDSPSWTPDTHIGSPPRRPARHDEHGGGPSGPTK